MCSCSFNIHAASIHVLALLLFLTFLSLLDYQSVISLCWVCARYCLFLLCISKLSLLFPITYLLSKTYLKASGSYSEISFLPHFNFIPSFLCVWIFFATIHIILWQLTDYLFTYLLLLLFILILIVPFHIQQFFI